MARKNEKTESSKERFVAVRKNNEGNLCEFKSNTGKVYDYEMAIESIEQGKIEGAMLFTGRDGKQHIRSKNDGDPNTKFSNLKEF